MVTKRQKQAGGAAVALLLLIGSVYAWRNMTLKQSSEITTKDNDNKVMLVNKFEPVDDWLKGGVKNNDISVKNATEVGKGNDAYVRINLKEFLEFTDIQEHLSDTRYRVDETGEFLKFGDEAAAVAYAAAHDLPSPEYIATTAREGDNQWFIPTEVDGEDGEYGKFLVLSRGTGGTAVPIYGGTNQADTANRDKSHNKKNNDTGTGEDSYALQKFDSAAPVGTGINGLRQYEAPSVNPLPADVGMPAGEDLRNFISWDFGPDVVMMADFDPTQAAKGQWVIDPDSGWVYWSVPLRPATETSKFLDSLTLTEVPKDVNFYYAVHANLEAVDFTDIPLMSAPAKILQAWDKVGKVYVATYRTDAGVLTRVDALPGLPLVEPTPSPTQDGYHFVGWSPTGDKADLWQFATDVMPADSLTLYAVWEPIVYTVDYTLDNGTNNENNPETYTIDDPTITLLKPTKTGNTFEGWHTADDGNADSKINKIVSGSTGDKALYANWVPKTYTIAFNTAGGTAIGSIQATFEQKIAEPTPPIKTGYTFMGWYKEAAYENPWNFATDTVPAKNTTIYAKWDKDIYAITYHLNQTDGLVTANHEDNPATYSITTKTINLKAPTQVAKTFDGWYTTPTFEDSSKITQIIKGSTGPVTLYAKWKWTDYTVNFNSQGGTTVASQVRTYNTLVATPTSPTKTHYNFAGWYKEAACINAWNFASDKVGVGNVTLYAKWTPANYTIGYTLNNGTNYSGAPTTYTIESNEITLGTPTRNGYTFAGWYKEASFTNKVEKIVTGSSGNLSLYAKWTANTYTVTFNLNSGTQYTSPTPPANFTPDSATITLGTPTRTGYTFNGWFDNASFTGLAKTTIPTGTVGNLSLYAKWTPTTNTITYTLNGGTNYSGAPTTYTIESNDITLGTPTRDGYTFAGWYKEASFTTQLTKIVKGSSGNLSLYAKWTANTYTVTFYLNSGTQYSSPTPPANFTPDSATITLGTPTRTGYTFNGWFDNAAFTGLARTNIPTGTVGNLSLYAKWTLTDYTVTFQSNGGTTYANQTGKHYQDLITNPGNPTKTGNTFASWHINSDLSGAAWNFASDKMPASNVTLYAKYTPLQYNLTYNYNYTGAPAATVVTNGGTYGLPITKPADPTRLGYTFAGWYTETGCTNQWKFNGESGAMTVSGALTLYAKWTVTPYTITYNTASLSGATTTNPTSYNIETATITLSNPTARTDYTFAGWWTAASGGTQVTAIAKGTTGNQTLYARWTSITYGLTLDVYTGNPEIAAGTVTYPTTVTSYPKDVGLTLPTTGVSKSGYTFGGWYSDAELTTPITAIAAGSTGAKTVYAKLYDNTQIPLNTKTAGTTFTFAGATWRILNPDVSTEMTGKQALILRTTVLTEKEANTSTATTVFTGKQSSANYYFQSSGTAAYLGGQVSGALIQYSASLTATDLAKVLPVNQNMPTLTIFKSKSGVNWSYNSGTGFTGFYQDLDFEGAPVTSGTAQAFALSYGDINTYLNSPGTTSTLLASSADYWTRSAGSAYNGGGYVTAAGKFNNTATVTSSKAVAPAMFVTIK